MARVLRADGAIVPEPGDLDIWIACRGSLLPTITVEGRPGHAGIAPRHPDAGGPVNAIEKMAILLEAVRRLREEWALRPRHPYLSAAEIVPTMVAGGEWVVSYPASCRLDCHIEYLPEWADETGFGSRVEREFEDWIARAAATDPWLREHPPRIEWLVGGVPPAEVAGGRSDRAGGARRDPCDRPPGCARRPRQLARRRHADRRGRHSLHLPRAGRHPPRAHDATSRSRSTISSTAARRSPSRRSASAGRGLN